MTSIRSMTRGLVVAALVFCAANAAAAGNVVISQVYGSGGNSGAPLNADYVELFNRSAVPVSVAGWSVQYASATGTGNFSGNGVATLAGTIQPGQYYLVRLGNGGGAGAALPAFDASGTTNISGSAGKVVLANVATGLTCNGGSTPCSPAQLAQIVDLVGYGNANFFETAAAVSPNPALSMGLFRAGQGCTDTDSNAADFANGAPAPRNSAAPLSPCGGNQPVLASCPASLAVTVGVGGSAAISASDADGMVITASITSAPVSGISLSSIAPGTTLTASLDVAASVTAGNYPVTVEFSNADAVPQTGTCTVAVNVANATASVRIHDIQGASHLSPLNGQSVGSVPGIVTGVRSNGFYFQDPLPDADPATSEGVFVFTSSAPTVVVGDSVLVSGTVSEFRPGGTDGLGNLTTTEIVGPVVSRLSSGNALPAPVVLGAGGRAVPTTVIDNDAAGSVETSGSFDPATDGIDFYESLEGMRVRINNAVATGPTNSFGELSVIADNGTGAGVRTARGGIVIRSDDFNPERMILDDAFLPTPVANVGDSFASVTAIVDYTFGTFKFEVTDPLVRVDNGLAQEISALVPTPGKLTIASFNVENLAPTNPPEKFAGLAAAIVNRLRSPDIVALMEVQDNNGATNDAVVDATTTFNTLIAAISAAGGPAYQFRSINPVDDQDGGEPGGNIRVGFLFNPGRVTFVDRPGGGSTVAVSVVPVGDHAELSFSPGRIDPTNTAWTSSRKPLAGEFQFNGRHLFVIANHFNSKGGDDPLFGRFQPPTRSSETQRHLQATIENDFLQDLYLTDPNAPIIVLGDLNDFEFSDTVSILKTDGVLVNLVDQLPPDERYTYVFEGNSQVLDQILVSPPVAAFGAPEIDAVHINSEFAAQLSDHDPPLMRLELHRNGDVDGDGDIDSNDVSAVLAARGRDPVGPWDPRDYNNDFVIDARDARLVTLACTRPRCAP